MTKDAIRKVVEEALNISAVEEELVDIISDELDPRGIAQVIWTMYGVDILEAAAEVAAESLLPF
jgi:hypothetical protein